MRFRPVRKPTPQVGQHYKVTGNYVTNNRARGMVLKGSNGLIESNIVIDTTLWCGTT